MAKLNKTIRIKETVVVKDTNMAVVKKLRKKQEEESNASSDVHEGDSRKLKASNEVTTFGNSKRKKKDKKTSEVFRKVQINTDGKAKRKMKKGKLDAQNIKSLEDVSTKYSRKCQKPFVKVEITASGKLKGKKGANGRKSDLNFVRSNKDATEVNDAKERKRKLQTFGKDSINLEHKRIKIEKLKKMSGKKVKRMAVEAEAQQVKPDKVLQLNKYMMKIRRLEEMLTSKLQAKKTLKDRMAQLELARFRFINEMLSNSSSLQAKCYFKQDPEAFKAYQTGYKGLLKQWAMDPLDIIISSIRTLPTDNVIADFGCGEARLAVSVPHTVYSFDFIATNDWVNACDMARTLLRMNSVHVVVFCLSLTGSNLGDYILEANRVLKHDGILKIAEIGSRFEDVKDFIKLLRCYGFKNTWKDLSHELFYFMDFKKEKDVNVKKKAVPPITLKSYLHEKK
ncbi:PREDICTED: ribosomal RNA-processing protein 8-like [Vollenhovia emeryi]|uniref:ribosomal RNA-processing protein 8-like n=1 Tax=Vollenhovia emeryi TaxID=411798 RepID=UPI0005F52E88|nr:PREDICTED: ribosomal RNA-processing protein 8-like [Vollenhovia emeryi]